MKKKLLNTLLVSILAAIALSACNSVVKSCNDTPSISTNNTQVAIANHVKLRNLLDDDSDRL